MNRTGLFARRGVFFRLIAYAGLCAVLVFGYARWPAAVAQEKDDAPAAATEKSAPAAEKPPSEAPLTPQQAQRLAEEALAADTGGKKPPVVVEKPHFDLIKEILDRPEHMWAVWLILAVSVVAMTAAIERLLGLRRRRVVPAELVASLKALAAPEGRAGPAAGNALCRQYPSSAATVVKTMLQKIGRPIAEIEHAVADTSEREASRLYANVRWQSLAFNVAPMLGLAGTVYGMLLAFFTTANLSLGENRMATLATGIYAALDLHVRRPGGGHPGGHTGPRL